MMKALDIRKSQTVVIYETGKGWFATRAAFMLWSFGHPKVHLLDGNFPKSQAEGRPIDSQSVEEWATDFDYELDESKLLGFDSIKELSSTSGEEQKI